MIIYVIHKVCNFSQKNIHEDFFMKIDILSPKVYKNVPNIEAT